MRIAVASSGLGHVARGIETWAEDTAAALRRRGVDVTLFAAGRRGGAGGAQVSGFRGQESEEPGTKNQKPGTRNPPVSGFRFQVSGSRKTEDRKSSESPNCSIPESPNPRIPEFPNWRVAVPCFRRGGRVARVLARAMPGFTWRWGLKGAYGWEQLSFWLRLWPRLLRGRYDVLHVQDPLVADWCRRFRGWKLVRTREILAHGTEEPVEFLRRFEFVQHLAPWHLEQAMGSSGSQESGVRSQESEVRSQEPEVRSQESEGGSRKSEAGGQESGGRSKEPGVSSGGTAGQGQWSEVGDRGPGGLREFPHWIAISNFVDCRAFRPAAVGERDEVRRGLALPSDAFVIGSVAALKRDQKRVDHLIREFAHLPAVCDGRSVRLLVAGASHQDTENLRALAGELAPGRVVLLADVPRGRMPAVYRAMDVCVLASLFEMMPIAVIEAMASGVPVVVNRHPVLEWIAGEGGAGLAGGMAADMSADGWLAPAMETVTPVWIEQHGRAARQRAEQEFGDETVVGRYMAYYGEVIAAGRSVASDR